MGQRWTLQTANNSAILIAVMQLLLKKKKCICNMRHDIVIICPRCHNKNTLSPAEDRRQVALVLLRGFNWFQSGETLLSLSKGIQSSWSFCLMTSTDAESVLTVHSAPASFKGSWHTLLESIFLFCTLALFVSWKMKLSWYFSCNGVVWGVWGVYPDTPYWSKANASFTIYA